MTRSSVMADARGASTIEFALVAPTFLMFIFLILDGGRMIFTKQALNELASASARCAALKPIGCTTTALVQNWTVTRGLARSQLAITAAQVTVNFGATCNGQSGMASVAIAMPYRKGALNLLPQSAAPSTLNATSCFPVAS